MISLDIGMGFGLHSYDFPAENISAVLKDFAIAGALSIAASIWSKTSFAFTILRLTDGWINKLVWFLIISMNIFMGLSAIFNFVHCQPVEKFWDFTVEGTCWPPNVLVDYNIFSAGMPFNTLT